MIKEEKSFTMYGWGPMVLVLVSAYYYSHLAGSSNAANIPPISFLKYVAWTRYSLK